MKFYCISICWKLYAVRYKIPNGLSSLSRYMTFSSNINIFTMRSPLIETALLVSKHRQDATCHRESGSRRLSYDLLRGLRYRWVADFSFWIFFAHFCNACPVDFYRLARYYLLLALRMKRIVKLLCLLTIEPRAASSKVARSRNTKALYSYSYSYLLF